MKNQKAQAKANQRYASIKAKLVELKSLGEDKFIKANIEGKTASEAENWKWYFNEKLKPLADLTDDQLMDQLYDEAFLEVASGEECIEYINSKLLK